MCSLAVAKRHIGLLYWSILLQPHQCCIISEGGCLHGCKVKSRVLRAHRPNYTWRQAPPNFLILHTYLVCAAVCTKLCNSNPKKTRVNPTASVIGLIRKVTSEEGLQSLINHSSPLIHNLLQYSAGCKDSANCCMPLTLSSRPGARHSKTFFLTLTDLCWRPPMLSRS